MMKVGDFVQWEVSQGRSKGNPREGTIVAEVKAGEDARVVLAKHVGVARGLFRINDSQAVSKHNRYIVEIKMTPNSIYVAPRCDQVRSKS